MINGFFTASTLKSNPLIKKASSCVVADINILWLELVNNPNFFVSILYGDISILFPVIKQIYFSKESLIKSQLYFIHESSLYCDKIDNTSDFLSYHAQ